MGAHDDEADLPQGVADELTGVASGEGVELDLLAVVGARLGGDVAQ